MKKGILLTLILFICFKVIGQNNDNLNGKWKIITIEAVFFHDFRNDSTFYPPEFLETLKGNKDSAFMIGFFDGMIKGFENYYYEFKDNNEYQENKNGKIKEQGSFTVIAKDKTIILLTKNKFGTETKQILYYELTDKLLLLKIPSEEIELKMQLIKTE